MNAEEHAIRRRRWFPRFAAREVEVPAQHEDSHDHGHEHSWKAQLVASGICLVFAVAGHLVGHPIGSLLCYIAAYVAGAWYTVGEVWERLQEGLLDVHFLMLAVAAGAAAIGKWEEGATLLFLFSASSALEHYAMDRTQRAIHALFHAAPKTAIVLTPSGGESTVPVEELRPGMRLLVRPGELFPVDAEIAKGETAADESNLTGEAIPVEKGPGDSVLAGTLNLNGSVEAIVARQAQESALHKIIDLIQNAQQSKAPSQRFTDRFGSGYTYAVLALTAAMFLVWWLLLDHAPFRSTETEPSAFYHAMTLLVVASPCALVLSIPSAILAAIASGARRGILFRGGAAVEQLAQVRLVAMDKTGTLTTGDLRVESVESFPPGKEREILQWAATLERHSTHPLARAILRYAKREGVVPRDIESAASAVGSGITARVDGKEYRIGKRAWALPESAQADLPELRGRSFGVSEVWLHAPDLTGRILLRDEVRLEARSLIEALRERGLRTIVLTGDRQEAAAQLAKDLALDEVRAELKPEEKLEIIRAATARGDRIAMIGDGVNDAPSIAAAHVGVAMGARGSDAALEQADVVLMHDRLENFLAAYELSRRSKAVIHQNVGIALGVIVILVGMALFQRIPLTIGVLGHEGSTLLVVLNSLRLLAAPRSAAPTQES